MTAIELWKSFVGNPSLLSEFVSSVNTGDFSVDLNGRYASPKASESNSNGNKNILLPEVIVFRGKVKFPRNWGNSEYFIKSTLGTRNVTDWENSKLALDIAGGLFGMGKDLVRPNRQTWLGRNGRYYSDRWGGNRYTGSRSGALKSARIFKFASRATIAATIAIGAVETYNGYLEDGNSIGYNTSSAAAQTLGGLAGGAGGAIIGAKIGGFIGFFFYGVGAVPGAAIGAFIGGYAGGQAGSWVGKNGVDLYYR